MGLGYLGPLLCVNLLTPRYLYYNRSIREFRRGKGLRSKRSPREEKGSARLSTVLPT